MRITKLILLLAVILLLGQSVAFSNPGAEDYLCELGVEYYNRGMYEASIQEFKKVLLINPSNQVAKEYIDKITSGNTNTEEDFLKFIDQDREKMMERALDKTETDSQTEARAEKFAEIISRQKQKSIQRPITAEKKKAVEESPLKISGEVQARFGITSEDAVWKRANYDLNERNWRRLSEAAFDRRENTYDTRVFDRLRVNLDTDNQEGFNFHSNITVDPWSFTGRSDKVTVTSAGGDTAEVELKYWSNTGYTINETINTLQSGDTINIPEIKVSDSKTSAVTLTSNRLGDSFTIPELKIHREFQPVRELWLDYQQQGAKFRFFPFAFQDQALTTDDPLRLSNNYIWWEASPWIRRWKPGVYNPAGVDFTKGYWDSSISAFARDSDGARLTNLRGFSFELEPSADTIFKTTFAVPKHPWQEYSDVDNTILASRFKQRLGSGLDIGLTHTMRMGFNLDDGSKIDARNNLIGFDLGYELTEGLKASFETAYSKSEYDLSNEQYKTKSRGNAYYFSILGRYPRESIMNTQNGYDGIKFQKGEDFLAKMRFFGAHMDEGFDPSLSSYRETRDDESWSRHIHFRKPLEYYYLGFYDKALTWDDIKASGIGNGIDIGRDVIGFRLETFWKDRFNNLFDVRNVHETGGKYIETVARDQATWTVNDKLTAKALGIYHDLPKTKAGIDPFIFDYLTGRYYTNDQIEDGKDPSLRTGSLGVEYKFFDWLALNGIWERTNDYLLGYDNFPRGLLIDDTYNGYTFLEGGNVYRADSNWLYSQQYFTKPPYAYYNIFKTGLRINPTRKLELYFDYTRNEFKSAGQADDNMNHFGMEIKYLPTTKLGLYFRYVYSRWQDIDRLVQGISESVGHHNFFAELAYHKSKDEDFVLQYGEMGRNPVMGEIVVVGSNPYGESLQTIDTIHILRLYYSRRF